MGLSLKPFIKESRVGVDFHSSGTCINVMMASIKSDLQSMFLERRRERKKKYCWS